MKEARKRPVRARAKQHAATRRQSRQMQRSEEVGRRAPPAFHSFPRRQKHRLSPRMTAAEPEPEGDNWRGWKVMENVRSDRSPEKAMGIELDHSGNSDCLCRPVRKISMNTPNFIDFLGVGAGSSNSPL
ncbi:hypothetical protein SAY86_025000 [Trapa natans]|uniref:Uncharacterized protein n=1 Tax=Trapa natans TaxID=22666 RepID=A0AAN7M5E5_TRANT|nr:hypothetical protein SAY86_025000 [Trapa natans]